MNTEIGYVIAGSLTNGFIIRIASHTHLELVKAGKFVCVAGATHRFFSLITNLSLEVTHPDITLFPPGRQTLLHNVMKARDIYATAELKPMIMLDKHNTLMPVKTIPEHFSAVFEADRRDIPLIFGQEAADKK